ncbi:isoleucine--tRNA ligase [Haloferula sp. A504]|uniref:isoleucine--tRNA ligase n=1 Tax=Haloferula sp. A504 TaxID=3373601 RepID=UPI0031C4CF7D|nr:isoleucine--tRNA ligase [Verrucomicrobiaceae bacterium E54]
MSADYKDTILLPRTDFPMRGDLVKREPERLARWESESLYERIIARRRKQDAPKFVLHDGPPFANGDVHMGTALNKVLKDLVVKSKTMAGHEVPFIPGWDCHGLPIEFKVVQQTQGLEPAEIRRRSTEFAEKFIEIQRGSFKRLGVFGDWENPYLTMDPAYEAEVVRVFAKLVEDGVVYQSKKPVQWSYGAHTALAEAEVEYQDKISPSIFVKFALTPMAASKLGIGNASIAIWTTTPWTLPANLAVAVHPEFTYVVGQFDGNGRKEILVVVRELVDELCEKTGMRLVTTLKELKGRELENLEARHPFLDRPSKIILGNFVTTETGTGAVHIAPGHGADDYAVGRQYDLGVLSPVDDDGNFTDECGVPDLVGKHVFESNERVIEILTEKGVLLAREDYHHSYPHCWRSKTPIIFRAVEQFFISIDTLRDTALAEIGKTEWLPSWGRNRIHGTVEARPDWCISRQRTWGVPLPVFFKDGQAVLCADTARKVADLVEKEGTNVWFELSDEEMCERLGLEKGLTKCRDTLDVWIDSGCSHVAVLEKHPQLDAPADLYLEATDQHRGWFQSSLMMSVAWRGCAPYKSVLTHGFVVDKDKKKLSKSEAEKSGKPIDAAHFYNKYGSDIVRLWVSSVDWQNEVPFGEDLFKQVAEPYRRLRNTLRILLGNLEGFDPGDDRVAASHMPALDKWILERLHDVVGECRKAYERYEFRKVFNELNQFCATDLSAVYIDATKDRMYCDAAKSVRRRATQTAMYDIFSSLTRLLAPILAFTADEAWEFAPFTEGSVHEQDFPEPDPAFAGGEATKKIARLLEIRHDVQQAIEERVKAKAFKKNNEASVKLVVKEGEPAYDLLNDETFAKEFFIVAGFEVTVGGEFSVKVEKADHGMCPRCRRYEPLVDEVCERCAGVVARA